MSLRDEAGSGLIMSIMVLAVFAIVSVTIYAALRYMSRESIYYSRAAQAHEEAEAGLEDSLYQLRLNTAWRDGFSAKPLLDGYYTVTLSPDDPPIVTATGYSGMIFGFGRVVRTIQVKAKYYGAPPVHVGWEPGSWRETYLRQ